MQRCVLGCAFGHVLVQRHSYHIASAQHGAVSLELVNDIAKGLIKLTQQLDVLLEKLTARVHTLNDGLDYGTEI